MASSHTTGPGFDTGQHFTGLKPQQLQPTVPTGHVRFSSDDPSVSVDCEQAAPIVILPPKPKIQTVDLPGATGLTQWVGQDPYELLVAVRLDGYPDVSVEADIATLEGLAEVRSGRDEPPIVQVTGAIPLPHPNLKWRVQGFTDPEEQIYLKGGRDRCRYATTVSLIQYVTDSVLARSLQAPGKTRHGKALQSRSWTVRADENDLYDVARHALGNPMRASDIATANRLRLGTQLKAGQKLTLP